MTYDPTKLQPTAMHITMKGELQVNRSKDLDPEQNKRPALELSLQPLLSDGEHSSTTEEDSPRSTISTDSLRAKPPGYLESDGISRRSSESENTTFETSSSFISHQPTQSSQQVASVIPTLNINPKTLDPSLIENSAATSKKFPYSRHNPRNNASLCASLVVQGDSGGGLRAALVDKVDSREYLEENRDENHTRGRLDKILKMSNFQNPKKNLTFAEIFDTLQPKIISKIAKFNCEEKDPGTIESEIQENYDTYVRKLQNKSIPAETSEKYDKTNFTNAYKHAIQMYKGVTLAHPSSTNPNKFVIQRNISTQPTETIAVTYNAENKESTTTGDGTTTDANKQTNNRIDFRVSKPTEDNIDLLIETVMHAKKNIQNTNTKFIIYPHTDKQKLIQLFQKAKKYNLNPILENYPASNPSHMAESQFIKLNELITQRMNEMTLSPSPSSLSPFINKN